MYVQVVKGLGASEIVEKAPLSQTYCRTPLAVM